MGDRWPVLFPGWHPCHPSLRRNLLSGVGSLLVPSLGDRAGWLAVTVPQYCWGYG